MLEVGRVARPHGVKGELRVRLHRAESDALERVERVVLSLDDKQQTFAIEHVRRGSGAVLVKLRGVDDRDAADAVRGARISVDRASLPIAPDEYYLVDLVGATVVAPDGEVGVVVEVRSHATVDTLVIRTPEGPLVEQVVADAWIDSVDVEAGRLVLNGRDGLIEG